MHAQIEPPVESQLNERQRKIMEEVHVKGSVTTGWCRSEFDVSYDTAQRDIRELMELSLLKQIGKGRATRYERAVTK